MLWWLPGSRIMKRAADGTEVETGRPAKKARPLHADHLSTLSDELILRVLVLLQPGDICKCQRLSRKFQALAGDSALWRAHYFDRFIRPRASRLPGLKNGTPHSKAQFPSRTSRWLDEQYLVEDGAQTDWKKQYKLRHNWSRGTCDVGEIPVGEHARIPPMVVQMHDGIIFTADLYEGLRAWTAKGRKECLAQSPFEQPRPSPPTTIAVDASGSAAEIIRLVVGFEDGHFEVFRFRGNNLFPLCRQSTDSRPVISSVAMSWPYVLTMSATQRLTLHKLVSDQSSSSNIKRYDAKTLHILQTQGDRSPLCVSIRYNTTEVAISVAYALSTYSSGWTVGIQEIKLDLEGNLTQSRTASAIDGHYRPLAFTAPPMTTHLRGTPAARSVMFRRRMQKIHSKPTSLSYTHPYLLASHPDNTLTFYLVFSSADELSISAGSRLWGHTSSVSGAHVGGRGKAVSISRRGDELRIWELEGGFTSDTARKRLTSSSLSVRVKPASLSVAQNGVDVQSQQPTVEEEQDELAISRGWIGFDTENVAVLREESSGKQALVVYDFT